MPARRLASGTELQATLLQRRAVVYISVEWAVQERYSRNVFAEFVEQVETSYPDLGISFWVLGEESDGRAEWFKALDLTGNAGAGYGAVVWLTDGEATDVVDYAAPVGTDGLVKRTLAIWQSA